MRPDGCSGLPHLSTLPRPAIPGSEGEEMSYFLSINRCPRHGYMSVSIDQADLKGSGCGTRVTPDKCCGQWNLVRKWELPAWMWEQLADEAIEAAKAVKPKKPRKGASR